MEIKTFGKISEIIDSEISFTFPKTLGELKLELEKKHPLLSDISYTIAVDDKIMHDNDFVIKSPKNIAILPPFSGG